MREYEILTSKTCSLGEEYGWREVLSFPREYWKSFVMQSTSRLYVARLLERRTQRASLGLGNITMGVIGSARHSQGKVPSVDRLKLSSRSGVHE